MALTLDQVQRAREILRPHLPVTRLIAAESLSSGQRRVFLKLENEMPTGSFKPRGALYALTTELGRRPVREVTACSTGNHGAAVAFAAKKSGIEARIFLPRNPNPVKRARIAALGAQIVEAGGEDLANAFAEADAYSQRDGVYFLNDATDPDLTAGPGTIAAEIFEQHSATEVIVVPMGDTALIRGVAAAAKTLSPGVKIVGVQAERAPSYVLSWREGRPCRPRLATRSPTAWPRAPRKKRMCRRFAKLVDEVRLISDEQMLAAIRHLLLEEHVLAEPAGAAATAAILQESPGFSGEVVALVTGANITPEILRRAVGT